MDELAGRLSALDPDAGAAVRVIAYFDRLTESRAGLEALVRGAAVLAGCPARLADPERHVRIRVEPDGTRKDADPDLPPDAAWPHVPLTPGQPATLWLERIGSTERTEVTPPSVVDAVILERAAGAIRQVLDRTRGRAYAGDADLVEAVLDAEADEQARLLAAHRLGLDTVDPGARFRAVAEFAGRARVLTADADLPSGRLGVGVAVPVLDLPHSWATARKALRFTAAGTAYDPGHRVVRAEELGDIALLEKLVEPGAELPPDASALGVALADASWMLVTLHAVATTASLRAAAAEINVHHSTLQARIAHAEALLGWSLHTPHGLLRLHIALILRHLAQAGTARA